jgi:hypothetical protein
MAVANSSWEEEEESCISAMGWNDDEELFQRQDNKEEDAGKVLLRQKVRRVATEIEEDITNRICLSRGMERRKS